MNQLILVLLVLAVVLYVLSGMSRFLKFQLLGHDPTVWWRGSMGLLGFSIALMILRILHIVSTR
ncbi:MAG TPA: hypothetical protein VMG63_01280 [Terriglobia bacterium]|jgi:hypothetical protein|nr:hypothetical protein [Terriglobia bacterium]